VIERFKAEIAVESRDLLGEGPVWDASGNRLLWGDHAAHVLREARSNGADSWRETRRWNLKLPLAAAIPRGSGGLILVAGTEILTFDENLMNAVPQSKQAIKSFAQISASSDLIRFNDAKCDAKGRLWATTLSSDFKRDAAGLYRIDADGVTTEILAGLTLGNGMGWSPDSSVFYLVESFTREVLAFDFDLEHGCLGGRRVFGTD
jgi:sugar lactone lactonase YvrE